MSLLTGSSTFYDIVATTVETLYDHNITTDLLEVEELLSRRLHLILRLDHWKTAMPSTWSPCSALELQHKSIDELESVWPSAFLSIHYRRAQLLINGQPIIFALREWILGSDSLPYATTELLASVLQNDFNAGKELVGVVRELVRPSSRVLQRHNMWFLANYSGNSILHLHLSRSDEIHLVFAACVHFFGLLLACVKQQSLLFAVGISLAEVRRMLQEGLELLKTVGSKSLMSQKGAACLFTFLDVFDSFGKPHLYFTIHICYTHSQIQVAVEVPSHSSNTGSLMDTTATLIAADPGQPTVGLLSDFIMQTTDDFFFGGATGDFTFDQYSGFP